LPPAACQDSEGSITRGDRFWADSNYTSALAEYRLALRHHENEPELLLRVAHAYAETGQLQPARQTYEKLLQRSGEFTDQAVFDYVTLARQSLARGDRYGMASAMEAALALQPGLSVPEFAAPLARYYASTGDAERALAFFERALSRQAPDSAAELELAIATIHEAQGNCREATGYFQDYLRLVPRGQKADEARYHIGNCSLAMARDAHQSGQLNDALALADTVIALGVPQNAQDQAWFERGEILLALGRNEDALAAYNKVLELNPLRTGQLVERAQKRIDEVRFGAAPPPPPR
jgi:tetratricopeptide (TPR) repeat protein